MPRWISIDVHCPDCDSDSIVLTTQEEKDDLQVCEHCSGTCAVRVISVPNVSTSTRSESIPDTVAAGRFDELRTGQTIRKELSKAKKAYAANPSPEKHQEIKRARKEQTKFKGGK